MPSKWIRVLLASAGAILVAGGVERWLCALSPAPMSQAEVLLGIPLRLAFALVGIMELAMAWFCLFGKRPGLQMAGLAWLLTNYYVYRYGLPQAGVALQGSAIGHYVDPLRVARGGWWWLGPWYLLVGSYAALLWCWWGKRRAKAAGYQKMSCPACGRHIKFAVESLGQKIPCPQCQTTITLRKPEETLKISCFFCQGHIEFPSHAIGEKMPCPHCKMDITLKEPT